jgi:hypothetical protein
MYYPICATCGTQFAEATAAPAHCPVCEDDRQYVGWQGQRWTTMAELASSHTLRLEDDGGVLGIGLAPGFGIDQRAMWLPTDAGNILWETVSLVNDDAVAALKARGGVDLIAISHPHFYASMVEWSEALGGVPILLHGADRSWVRRGARQIEQWHGELLTLGGGVTLIRTGGHFPGSTALHWATGPHKRGALFVGDSPQVTQDRRGVSFMYSYPNYTPMRASDVHAMRERLAMFDYDEVFGFSWGRNILGNGKTAIERSFDRFFGAIAA